jgi:hypothetical protein
MRISYLASAVLTIGFVQFSIPAFASCNSASCASSGQAITYGSGSYSRYNTGSTPTQYRSKAHVSQGINTRFGVAKTAACPSGAIRASNGYCASSGNSSSVGRAQHASFTSGAAHGSSYGSSYSSSYNSTAKTVPFTTTVNKIYKHRVAGMAKNEFLTPTTCPTSVYNPGGHKVLGCYSVVKPVQPVRHVQTVKHVQQIRYQQVRVVRPIIYVRYPVPTPMPIPAPVCRSQALVCGSGGSGCGGTTYSRYGNTWPQVRSNCGSW